MDKRSLGVGDKRMPQSMIHRLSDECAVPYSGAKSQAFVIADQLYSGSTREPTG
jgi:hypothetical protein